MKNKALAGDIRDFIAERNPHLLAETKVLLKRAAAALDTEDPAPLLLKRFSYHFSFSVERDMAYGQPMLRVEWTDTEGVMWRQVAGFLPHDALERERIAAILLQTVFCDWAERSGLFEKVKSL